MKISNKLLIQRFRESKFVNFVKFLDDLESKGELNENTNSIDVIERSVMFVTNEINPTEETISTNDEGNKTEPNNALYKQLTS